jgi:hypothetical protein
MAEGWDPSLALRGAPEGNILPNPLEFFGKMQTLQQQQNVNLKFRQENDARVAIGQAYAAATDPATGRIDMPTLMRAVAGNPVAQYLLGETAKAAQERETADLVIQQKRGENATQIFELTSKAFGGLQARGNDVTITDLRKTAAILAMEIGDPVSAKQIFLALEGAPAGGAELQQFITALRAKALPSSDLMDRTNPALVPTTLGGSIVQDQFNSITGVRTRRASDRTTLTPGEAAEQVSATDINTGQPVFRARSELVDEFGKVRPSAVPAAATGPQVPPPPGTATVPAQAGPVPLGPTAARSQEILKTGENFWKYTEDLDRRVSSGEVTLLKMQQMLQLADITRIGPLAMQRLKVAELAEGLGLPTSIVKRIAGSDPDQQASGIAAAQQFAKEAFSTAYESMKLMAPPGTQLTEGIALTNFENSIRLNMDKDAATGLVNNARKIFRYVEAERDFMLKWEGAPKDARAAWTDKVIRDKLVAVDNKPLPGSASLSGPGAQAFVRGQGVPGVAAYPDAEIRDMIPDGKLGRLPLPGGGSVLVRRRGNSLIKEGQE